MVQQTVIGGQMQLLIRALPSETGRLRVAIKPHHHRQRPMLVLPDHRQARLAGESFDGLQLEFEPAADALLVLGLYWPMPEPAEDDSLPVDAEQEPSPRETPALPTPTEHEAPTESLTPVASPEPPGETQDTAEKEDVDTPEPDDMPEPVAPARRSLEMLDPHLGRALWTGSQRGEVIQQLWIIHFAPVTQQMHGQAGPTQSPEP